MKLETLLKNCLPLKTRGNTDIEVSGVEYNSKKVKPGALFVAIPGFKTDGRAYVFQAVAQGASAVVFEGEFFENINLPQIRVANARSALALLSEVYFGYPSQKMYVAGVTGTNGKTTLTYLAESLWKEASYKTGVVGTINTRFGNKVWPSDQTTPESRDLQEIFLTMKQAQVSHVCMEVSSHALDLHRVDGLDFDAAVFTNLTQDHLDFHRDLENYYKAKEKLFVSCLNQSSKKNRVAIVYGDDVYGQKLLKILEQKKIPNISYGFTKINQTYPEKYSLSLDGFEGRLRTSLGVLDVCVPLMGLFNVANVLACVELGIHSGLNLKQIQKGLSGCKPPPGRLEKIANKAGLSVFVDYAHTPDALKNVLTTLKALAPGKIIAVFGCGGDRDPGKRPLMGYEVGSLADVAAVTSDNPRTENPETIIDAIVPGLNRAGMSPYSQAKGYLVEPDRKKAIEKALTLAKKDDVVLIAGKGHEDYQIIGTQKFPFSDQEIVREHLGPSTPLRDHPE